MRVLFMIVLACHIPFIYFSGKEALLIIIDEIDRRSISKSLEERIFALNLQAKVAMTGQKGRPGMPQDGQDRSGTE